MIRLNAFLVFLAVIVGVVHAQHAHRPQSGEMGDDPTFKWGGTLIQTRDGGFVSVGTATDAENDQDIILIKTDSDGNVRWTRTFGGPASDRGQSVVETSGGFLVGGFTESFGVGGFDCHLIGTDQEGARIWSTTHGTLNDDRCRSIARAPDGGILLLGESLDAETLEDCYLIKTDKSGNKLWAHTYGGPERDRCDSLAPTTDGGYLVVGKTYAESASNSNVYMVKTDSFGEAEWSQTATAGHARD